MGGSEERTGALFSYVDVDARIPPGHPLRQIRGIANTALDALDGDFAQLYPPRLGRPSIPPERLLRAMLLQAFYGIRSERQLLERIEFDLLFRWFVRLGIDETVWDHSSFTTTRERLLSGEIGAKFLRAVLAQPQVKRLLSSDHFSVDGTLVEADLRERSVTPHIAIDGHLSQTGKARGTAMDRRTTRHPGYAVSQRCRKRIEEVFGWGKGSAGLAKVKLRGQAKVDALFTLALAAYNLIRLPKLIGALA